MVFALQQTKQLSAELAEVTIEKFVMMAGGHQEPGEGIGTIGCIQHVSDGYAVEASRKANKLALAEVSELSRLVR